MSQALVLIAVFMLGIACLPWGVRWMQRRAGTMGSDTGKTKVLSVLAVGPQQRVVTVQVASGARGAVLVLGVTSSSVNCLHKWETGMNAVDTVGSGAVGTALSDEQ